MKNLAKLLIFVLFFCYVNHVLYSQSGWYSQNSGTTQVLRSIHFINNDLGFAVGNHVILKTSNGGLNWDLIKYDTVATYHSVSFVNNTTGFVGGFENVLIKTTNGGLNWSNIQISHHCYSVFLLNENTGYFTGGGVLSRTTNGGNNITIQGYGDALNASYFLNIQTGYATGGLMSNGTAYKTTNSGINWTGYGACSPVFQSLHFLNLSTGYICGGGGCILKTINAGVNYVNLIHLTDGNSFSSVFFTSIDTGFVVGGGPGRGIIYRTTNGGSNWLVRANSTWLNDVYFSSSITGYIVGDGGLILKTTTGGEPIGISQISNEIPINYYLHQNYPNPFNPVTNIKFDIPSKSNVKISIYDILGKEISVLVNEEMNPGTFEVNWDASNYPSGVYFYKIFTEKFAESRKMVLMK